MFIQPVARIVSTPINIDIIDVAYDFSKETDSRGYTSWRPGGNRRGSKPRMESYQEKLRELEERQRILLELAQRMQCPCDGSAAPVADGGTNHADTAPLR